MELWVQEENKILEEKEKKKFKKILESRAIFGESELN